MEEMVCTRIFLLTGQCFSFTVKALQNFFSQIFHPPTSPSYVWICAAGISEPLPNLYYSHSVANYINTHLSHFWANIVLISRTEFMRADC